MGGPHSDRHTTTVQAAVEGSNEVHPWGDTWSEGQCGVDCNALRLMPWNGEKDTGTQSILPSKAATTPTSETFIEHNVVRE